jgi:hypothetical protein
MGTRSLTYVYDETGEKIINLYRQFDGYPTGHGQELAEFLNSGHVVNGLSMSGMSKEIQFNGSGCLSAQLVAHFKKESGGFYLYPTSVEDCGQDYEYHIFLDGEIYVKIMDCGFNVFGQTQDDTYEPLFEGNLEQFTKYCAKEQYGDVEINDDSFENSIVGQEVLKKELKNGICRVVFEKQDGTDRVMHCTLSEDVIPVMDTFGVASKRAKNPDVLAVWDTDAGGWRSFRFDSIKSVVYPIGV